MILPDVNVLVYTFRTDAPHHAASHAWLTSVVDGNSAFGISPLALADRHPHNHEPADL